VGQKIRLVILVKPKEVRLGSPPHYIIAPSHRDARLGDQASLASVPRRYHITCGQSCVGTFSDNSRPPCDRTSDFLQSVQESRAAPKAQSQRESE
jgi:hypothetical protein